MLSSTENIKHSTYCGNFRAAFGSYLLFWGFSYPPMPSVPVSLLIRWRCVKYTICSMEEIKDILTDCNYLK